MATTIERLAVTVDKPTPYTHDLSHLTTVDPNPLPPTRTLLSQPLSQRNTTLKSIARDGAQTLLTTLLTSPHTKITTTSTSLLLTLPPPEPHQQTPRWKPLPRPKEPTKWEAFARKKGIGKFGGNLKGGAALEERRKNAVYNEETGKWEKKWGWKGPKGEGVQGDWLVELDDEKVKREKGYAEGAEGKTVRGEGKREKMERLRRQQRKERSNAKRGGKGRV